MKNLERWYYPKTIPEALEVLAEGGGRIKAIGGGTALAESRSLEVTGLVDITRIPELHEITVSQDGRCTLGAAVTAQDLVEARGLPDVVVRTLVAAAGTISHQMHRNVITLGGNIVQLYAWSDFPVALLALDATYVVQSAKTGTRRLTARELTEQHPSKVLEPDELLTAVELPAQAPRTGGTFLKFARTETDYALVTAASRVDLDTSGVVSDCRVVLGCAVPRPIRLDSVEAMVVGHAPSDELAQEAGARVKLEVTPMVDFRASVDYRREVSSVLVKRALLEAFRQVAGEAAVQGG